MSTKNYKQLMEDVRTNEELAKKLEEADKEMRRTGDKAGFIKAAAELGYEVTEQDFPADDLVKLDEEELDNVAGGFFFFGNEEENGHEMGCGCCYYVQREDLPVRCPNNSSGKHKFEATDETIPCQGAFSVYGKTVFVCKYCEGWTFIAN